MILMKQQCDHSKRIALGRLLSVVFTLVVVKYRGFQEYLYGGGYMK